MSLTIQMIFVLIMLAPFVDYLVDGATEERSLDFLLAILNLRTSRTSGPISTNLDPIRFAGQ